MNTNKLTRRSAEAIRSAQELAVQYGNPQVEQVHLLTALLFQEDGLVPRLLTQMGVTEASIRSAAGAEVEKLPKVSGTGQTDRIYISKELDRALSAAEGRAAAMGDAFTSVEHLLLGLLW